MKYATVLIVLLLSGVAGAQTAMQPGPTAAQIIANQIGQCSIQNAQLLERSAQLEAQVVALQKQIGELNKVERPAK